MFDISLKLWIPNDYPYYQSESVFELEFLVHGEHQMLVLTTRQHDSAFTTIFFLLSSSYFEFVKLLRPICFEDHILWVSRWSYSETWYLRLYINQTFLDRMTVDKRGQLTFCHIRETTFDINQYLIDLKVQLKSWRDMYWRVWGTIHYQGCSRCGETFSCTDYGHCKYHPEPPRYDNETANTSFIGSYPCCHQKCLRFDPTHQNKVNF